MSLLSKTAVNIEEVLNKWEKTVKPLLIENMKGQLIDEINSQMKVIISKSGPGLSKDEVEKLIRSALGVYDSDKTGLADYALEPAGN